MIKNMTQEDVLEENFQWGEHLWFEVPLEGGSAALDHHSDHEGYGFLYHLQENDPTFEVSNIPPHALGVDAENIGDHWEWYDEDRKVTFHAVYTHSLSEGFYPRYYRGDPNRIQIKLDEWWAEHETDVVWPMRIIRFGAGRTLASWIRSEGGFAPNVDIMLAPLAKTEAEFHIYWTD